MNTITMPPRPPELPPEPKKPPESQEKGAKKTRESSITVLARKTYQTAKQLEHAAQRDAGKTEDILVKLRSILLMLRPGLERDLRESRRIDDPGVREFLQKTKWRV